MDATGRNSRVSLGIGITLNIGNWQSVKLHISEEMDCLEDTPEEMLDYLQEHIVQQLSDRIQPVRDALGV